eukprot:6182094-Pleurochrysis_carterae.AAC.4
MIPDSGRSACELSLPETRARTLRLPAVAMVAAVMAEVMVAHHPLIVVVEASLASNSSILRGSFFALSPLVRRGTKHRAILQNLPSSFSWKELKDEMRRIGDVIYADVDNHGDG